MKKELVNKFDLEAAFKALDEIEAPVVRGIKPNRVNLQETFTKKLTSEILVEDYYDVNSGEELEAAQEEREAEIAKAKLARIEKIVDLDAESEEDLLPSYVGKVIIQCPQCMTLFYKNQEDIEKSEENPEAVNINEVCQHCGNASGYTLVGKVDTVGEEEAEEYDLDAFDDNELNLDFPEEGTEEVDPEGTGEAAEEEENVEDLELAPVEDTEEESNEEEEEVKESLTEDFEDEEEFEAEEVTTEAEAAETEEAAVEESEEEIEEEILTSVEEVKEIAAEAGEEVAEVVKEEPEIEAEEIKEITDEVVEKALEVEEETSEEEIVEDEIEEVVEESLTEEWVESVKSFKNPVVINLCAEGNMAAAIIEVGTETEAIEIDKQATVEYEEAGEEAESGWQYFEWIADDKNFKYCMIHDIYEEAFADIEYGKTISVEEAKQRLMKEDPEEAERILTEAVDKDLDDKLKAHNEYIEYLKEMIEKEENSLANAKNDFVKKSIQARIDALKADLEAALPEALKDEVEPADLPTPEEAEMEAATENKEEDVKESLTESMLEEALEEKVATAQKIVTISSIFKDIINHEFFKGLSARLVRKMVNDYVEEFGREKLSIEGVVNFYKETGLGTFILDNAEDLKDLQIKELAARDPKFIEAIKAYSKKYDILPAKDETEEEFVEDMLDICLNGFKGEELHAIVKEIGQFYVELLEGCKKVEKEELQEEADSLDQVLDSSEFKEPISDKEVEEILDAHKSEETEKEVKETFEVMEDFNENAFNEHVNKYLKEVYSNVANFEATECVINNDKLIIEGVINFNSGKSKTTKFIFESSEDVLAGTNVDLAEGAAFTLTYSLKEKELITESFKYSYTIENTLVEGLTQ